MQWTHRKKLVLGHAVLLVLLSGIFWQYFAGTVALPETSRVIITLVLASFLFAWMLAGFLLWKENVMKVVGAFIFTVPIFFQTTGWQAYLAGAAVAVLLYSAAIMVGREQGERLRFSSVRTLLVAKQVSVFAFSLALSLGYFGFIRSLSWDDLEPRLRLGKGGMEKILEWGGYIQPEFGSVIHENKTVDEYILSLNQAPSDSVEEEAKKIEQLSDEVSRLRSQGINVEFSGDALSSVRGVATEDALVMGRKQLSELAGRPVEGHEPVGEVFAEALQAKVSALLEGSRVRERIPDQALPFFIATLFFLTVWPIALLLFSLWSALAALFLLLVRSFGWIVIAPHLQTQERMED